MRPPVWNNHCGTQEKLSEHLSDSDIATCGAVLRGNQRCARTTPSEVVFTDNQPRNFSLFCASWFPTPSERSNENEEIPLLSVKEHQNSRIRQNHIDRQPRTQHSLNFSSETSIDQCCAFSVPGVPTNSSHVLFHHLSIFVLILSV